jgi:hypothetical protein
LTLVSLRLAGYWGEKRIDPLWTGRRAELTENKMSNRPKRSIHAWTARSQSSTLEMSQRMYWISEQSSRCRTSLSSTSVMNNLAFSLANKRHASKPKPLVPPVTKTTLSVKRAISSPSCVQALVKLDLSKVKSTSRRRYLVTFVLDRAVVGKSSTTSHSGFESLLELRVLPDGASAVRLMHSVL